MNNFGSALAKAGDSLNKRYERKTINSSGSKSPGRSSSISSGQRPSWNRQRSTSLLSSYSTSL